VPPALTLCAGLIAERLVPEGYLGVWTVVAAATVVALLEYGPWFRERRISLAWSATIAYIAIAISAAMVQSYRHSLEKFTWSPTALLQSRVNGIAFRVDDLARGENISVEDRLFEDCDIYGPGMIAFPDEASGTVQENHFDVPGTEAGAVAPPEDVIVAVVPPQKIFGAIACRGCTFRRCRFHGVQFLVTPQKRELMLRMMKEDAEHRRMK
jgi:hypothetical protein